MSNLSKKTGWPVLGPQCLHYGLCPRLYAEFLQYVTDVDFDGQLADDEGRRNLTIGLTFCEQLEDLRLSRRER